MLELSQPEAIFTHESDLDGFVSGCILQRLAKSLFNISVPLQPLSSNPWSRIRHFPKKAWVSDLAFVPKMDRRGWLFVDHHITDQKPRLARFIHDPNRCATKLCYDLFTEHYDGNDSLERLVHLTNIADLHLSDHADFVIASDYARLLKTYHFRALYQLIDSNIESLIDHPLLQMMQLKRQLEDPIGLNWSKNHITALSSEIAYVAITIGDSNFIVHKLLKDPNTPFKTFLTFFKKTGSPIAVSIRSQNGEALTLAKRLKGGGHFNAAGASLPRSVKTFEGAVAYLKTLLSSTRNDATSQRQNGFQS